MTSWRGWPIRTRRACWVSHRQQTARHRHPITAHNSSSLAPRWAWPSFDWQTHTCLGDIFSTLYHLLRGDWTASYHLSQGTSSRQNFVMHLNQLLLDCVDFGTCRICSISFSSVQFNLFNSSERKSQSKSSLKRWVLSPAWNWPRLMDGERRWSGSEFQSTGAAIDEKALPSKPSSGSFPS